MSIVKIRLTEEEYKYLMEKVAIYTRQEAVNEFSRLMQLENIDVNLMQFYIRRMMQKEGAAK